MHEHYNDKAIKQSTSLSSIPAKRGSILDRNGKIIAESYQTKSLWTDPAMINSPEDLKEFIVKASQVLSISEDTLEKACQKQSRFVWLARKLTFLQSQSLEPYVKKTSGIYFKEEWSRFYRSGEMMSPIIGIVGAEHQGLTGIEQRYEKLLSGQAGTSGQIRDAKRIVLSEDVIQMPVPGCHVELTLDMAIQTILFNELKAGYETFVPESASGMVMDVQTGEILAMATLPAHTPGQIVHKDLNGLQPRMVLDVFEPGSTMKPFIYGAILEQKLGSPDEIVDCGVSGYKMFGKRKLGEYHDHAYGKISLEQVIVKSSNIGTAHMALRLGNSKIYHLLKSMGFGEKNYLPLSGEPNGIFRPLDKWDTYSTISVPIGHEIGVTMTQMLRAYSAIGNNGYVLQPSLELGVRTYDGEVLRKGGSLPVGRVYSTDTCNKILRALEKVVQVGTAKTARSELYSIGGKTGTTEKIINGRYAEKNHNIASFVGLAPIDHPRIAVMIMMDGPTKGKSSTGGAVSAPVAKQVIENVLKYLGVPHKKLDDEV